MKSQGNLILLLAVLTVAGCRTPYPCDSGHRVADELQARVGSRVGSGGGLRDGSLPPEVTADDGLTQDEAVAIALWNNADFHRVLSQLGISAAQLYDAGLIPDPQFVTFLPLGPKQLEFSLFQAVDAFWIRPVRERAAELDLEQLSEQMVQSGLDLVRDTRIAHVELLLAQERARLAEQARELRDEIRALAEKRLSAGDISELEVSTARIDSLQARADAALAEQDLLLAQQALRDTLGYGLSPSDLRAIPGDAGVSVSGVDNLIALANAARPDLRAAEIRVEAAEQRVELACQQFMNLDAVFDSNAEGRSGFEAGPGLRLTLPVFNANDGGVAIAEAQAEQARADYVALRDRIDTEVRSAVARLHQSEEQYRLVTQEILPELEQAQRLARRNYEIGGVPYFLVLQTTGQLVDARVRRATAAAGILRASAEVERSVGQRLQPGSVEPPSTPEL